MAWNATTQGNWIANNFGPALSASKHKDVKLMVLDDQRPLAPNWCRELFSNKEAEPYVAGVAIHWYLDREFDLPLALDQVHQEFPDKFLFYSESCTGKLTLRFDSQANSATRGCTMYIHIVLIKRLEHEKNAA